jgi:hypothetical protein
MSLVPPSVMPGSVKCRPGLQARLWPPSNLEGAVGRLPRAQLAGGVHHRLVLARNLSRTFEREHAGNRIGDLGGHSCVFTTAMPPPISITVLAASIISLVEDDAGHHVDAAAGRVGDDQRDRARLIGLSGRGGRTDQQPQARLPSTESFASKSPDRGETCVTNRRALPAEPMIPQGRRPDMQIPRHG